DAGPGREPPYVRLVGRDLPATGGMPARIARVEPGYRSRLKEVWPCSVIPAVPPRRARPSPSAPPPHTAPSAPLPPSPPPPPRPGRWTRRLLAPTGTSSTAGGPVPAPVTATAPPRPSSATTRSG